MVDNQMREEYFLKSILLSKLRQQLHPELTQLWYIRYPALIHHQENSRKKTWWNQDTSADEQMGIEHDMHHGPFYYDKSNHHERQFPGSYLKQQELNYH